VEDLLDDPVENQSRSQPQQEIKHPKRVVLPELYLVQGLLWKDSKQHFFSRRIRGRFN
jgi:hypothetical protein